MSGIFAQFPSGSPHALCRHLALVRQLSCSLNLPPSLASGSTCVYILAKELLLDYLLRCIRMDTGQVSYKTCRAGLCHDCVLPCLFMYSLPLLPPPVASCTSLLHLTCVKWFSPGVPNTAAPGYRLSTLGGRQPPAPHVAYNGC